MVKRVVVGIDGSEYSQTAIRLACIRASKTGVVVVGVGVIDLPGISRQEMGAGAGASYYAHKAEQTKIADAKKKMAGFIAEFKELCKSYEIEYEIRSHEGVPFEEIIAEANFADLIYIGNQTFFHFGTNSKPGETALRISQYASCPVAAIPKDIEFPRNVLVALDGSKASARGLREFVDLYEDKDIFSNMRFYLISTGNRKKMATIHEAAMNYLRIHGLTADSIIRDGKPSAVILEEAHKLEPSMIVLGAYGNKGISRIFHGSTAKKIIEDGSVPVLITH